MATLTDIVRVGVNNMLTGGYDGLSAPVARVVDLAMQEKRQEFPDIRYEIESAIEKGNLVMFQYKGAGTHALSQRKVTWSGTGFARIDNGVVTKFRVNQDEMAQKLQIGEFPRIGFGPLTGSWRSTVLGGIPVKLRNQRR